MTLSLGHAPDSLTVKLVRGADFVCYLDSEDGDWPGTAVVSLVFTDEPATTWTATVDGASLAWNVDKAAVDALIGRLGNSPRARLLYVDGAADLVWAQGPVLVTRF